ncbi:MAG: oligopeptidase B [Acidobacteria bacterium]|nr:MAG: oligopeptidase B [Acidobacteriota bacterium]
MSKAFFPMALVLVAVCIPSSSCKKPESGGPPVAVRIPHTLTAHGVERVDDYYWLKERDNPEVIAYLEAENAFTASTLAHTEPLQKELFDEIVGRIKQDDQSVPYFENGYFYYDRFESGGEYPIYCRRMKTMDAAEEIILNINELSEGHEYFDVRGLKVSTDNTLLAFAEDSVGRRLYSLRFKNLDTGEIYPDLLPKVTGNVVWAGDNRTVFYTRQDPETLRSHRVFRHVLGTDGSDDVLVFEEEDETFSCSVQKTKSRRYVVIHSHSTLSDEAQYLDADNPTGSFTTFLPRTRGHEYSIDHFGDRFFIRTNSDAVNFRLMSAPVADTEQSRWEEVIPHSEDTFLETFEIFRDHLVVAQRQDGLVQLRVIPWSGNDGYLVEFDDAAYDAWIGVNPEFDTTTLRYDSSSLTTPHSVFDFDMVNRTRTLLKRDEVLGGFNPDDYVAQRLYATARDGVDVPISLVRRADSGDGPLPLLLYAYGSYGYSMDPAFRSDRLSLLDRGYTFAIAHVRGGQEYGRRWYEDGKLLHKKNTFTDFIDCADFLVNHGLTTSDELFAMGGSAGGLLMGTIVNMRPDLFQGVVAQVPFVDVITTMLDPDIPLTTAEYDEWGNPNEKENFDYMMSYSPYDQVKAQDYPTMLVTAGLHDSQVQYWEPAKWVAKLRSLKTDDHVLLLHTNMDAGHGGASGRFKQYEETALTYAFLLDQIGGSDGK